MAFIRVIQFMGSAPKPVLQHAELTEKIIGAFYCVYNDLGPGFLESVYKRSMAIEIGRAHV